MKHPIQILSLGPGDPELVTLKTLRLLKLSDAVYFPTTLSVTTGRRISRAGDILASLGIEESKLRPFEVPMEKGHTAAETAYKALAAHILSGQESEERVAVVAEGDAGIYASVHYVGDLLCEAGAEVQYTAGIPALIAAAAAAGVHIVKGEEPLLVLPSVHSPEEILCPLAEGKTVVVMKLSQSEEALKAAIGQGSEYVWHYVENIGTTGEFHTTSPQEILPRKFPYFSLLIVRR